MGTRELAWPRECGPCTEGLHPTCPVTCYRSLTPDRTPTSTLKDSSGQQVDGVPPASAGSSWSPRTSGTADWRTCRSSLRSAVRGRRTALLPAPPCGWRARETDDSLRGGHGQGVRQGQEGGLVGGGVRGSGVPYSAALCHASCSGASRGVGSERSIRSGRGYCDPHSRPRTGLTRQALLIPVPVVEHRVGPVSGLLTGQEAFGPAPHRHCCLLRGLLAVNGHPVYRQT